MHLFFRRIGPKRHKGRTGRQTVYHVELRPGEAVEKQGVSIWYTTSGTAPYETRRIRSIKPAIVVRGTLEALGPKIVSALHAMNIESQSVKFNVQGEQKTEKNRMKRALSWLKPVRNEKQIRALVDAVQSQLKAKNEAFRLEQYGTGSARSEQDLLSEHIKPTDRVAYLGANTDMQMDAALSHVGMILARSGRRTNRLTLVDRDHAMIWPGKYEQISEFAKREFWKLGEQRGSGDPIFHRMSQREFLKARPDVKMTLPKIRIADILANPIEPQSQDVVIDHGSNWFIVGAEGASAQKFQENAEKLAHQYDRFLRPGGKAIITFSAYKSHLERKGIMQRRMLETLAAKGYRIQVQPLTPGHFRLGGEKLSPFHEWAVIATKPKSQAEQRLERLRKLQKN